MAKNVFCKVAGIDGECSEKGHEKYFEVINFSHSMEQSHDGSTSGTGGHNAGRVKHGDFTVTKAVDKATPLLALACSQGKPIADIVIEWWRSLGENKKAMEYKMTKCVIKEIDSCLGEGGQPYETLRFSYAKIEWNYTQYDNDHNKVGDVPAHWDVAAATGG